MTGWGQSILTMLYWVTCLHWYTLFDSVQSASLLKISEEQVLPSHTRNPLRVVCPTQLDSIFLCGCRAIVGQSIPADWTEL